MIARYKKLYRLNEPRIWNENMHDINKLKTNMQISQSWIGKHQVSDWPSALEKTLPYQLLITAQKEISTWPSYQPTMLRDLTKVAKAAGVASVSYKDESTRFGLGSFKALGGAYAVVSYLAKTLSATLNAEISMQDVREGKFKEAASSVTVATATDGNHGRSVAWGAHQAGCNCKIYIHRDVSKGREQAMAEFGADVIRIDGDYDESVRLCAQQSSEHNWQVISDTSYDGYVDIPRLVMAGYTIMVREILDQLEKPPTHVIIQAGVGGLAAAICAAFWTELNEDRPRFIVCESEHADCIIESMKAGKASHVPVDQETIMAGLSCGEISLIAWEVLSRGASAVLTLPDDNVGPMMRYMANENIEAGECAVPGIISLLAASNDPNLMKDMKLDKDSRVLVFGCEGATDQEVYDRIINGSDA